MRLSQVFSSLVSTPAARLRTAAITVLSAAAVASATPPPTFPDLTFPFDIEDAIASISTTGGAVLAAVLGLTIGVMIIRRGTMRAAKGF